MSLTIETRHLETVIDNHTRDMSGKVVAITGTTSGTGYVCAREMAKLGATVLLLNRESERSASSLKELQEEVPDATFQAIECDLQDFESVRSAIEEIKSQFETLDVLCNNAGVMAMPDQATKDGYDVQMQTNCISHFLLTNGLFPLLKKSDEGRIVNHSSQARLGADLEMKYFEKRGGDLGGDGTEKENSSFKGPRWYRYRQTKLANCAFTYGLIEKLEEQGIDNIKVLLAHPGLAATQLQVTTAESGGMEADSDLMQNAQSPEDGATGIIRCCADPEAKTGDFYGPEQWVGFPQKLEPEDSLSDPENIRINWEGCEAAVGEFEF
ncbi:MAG: SDR family NAD(P)-dependent oxidoreductase [Balneolaceae bacterium]|nr:SDR family NAD(P)-dependent oxidoreductase [Balneolaceae bacterium]MBO6547510.1 SDR family NAD(P)-dependent oxidoreductase [Balneolaceae bacterium]MBO6647543.1 SDR family NAD(P)-dependent oxidoreductase [Balneolaceae bacterium]